MSDPVKGNKSIVVVGAGIVGTCCALYMRRKGFEVTLVERDEPGMKASFGNGGNLTLASSVPHSLPGLLAKVPGMLMDRHGPLTIGWRHLPSLWPWLLQFSLAGRDRRARKIATARHALLSRMIGAYAPLLAEAKATDLFHEQGLLYVWEGEARLASSAYANDLRRELGVGLQMLSGDQAREIEPALTDRVTHAMLVPQAARILNPLRLTQTLVRSFVRDGGTLLKADVERIEPGRSGGKMVVTDSGVIPADIVTIAAGVHSRRFASASGLRVPLEAERGYHAMIEHPGVEMRSGIVSVDRSIGIAPMEHGVRIVGISEFSGMKAAPRNERGRQLAHHAGQVVPLLRTGEAKVWMGERPSFPDSLPMIGFHPKDRGMMLAFGHDHVGLATAAITGRLVASIVAGETPEIDMNPYRPDRFTWK